MQATSLALRAWPPRFSNAPPPPPGTFPPQAGCPRIAAVMFFVFLTGLAGQTPAPEAKPAAAATYAGSEACQMCHEDIYTGFRKNPHFAVETDKKRGWATRACESCHGPGSKHTESTSAADIRNPAKLAPAETDRVCLTCHLNQPTHIGRIQGPHARNQVSCVACHAMHKSPEELRPRKMTAINAKCAQCHTAVWASFQRPYKHKLPEGAMSCVDCHNPHGTQLPRSIQTVFANEPGCFRCHGDKRGPFVFEHAPVRFQGCATCHEPHGSANPRMLTRQEVRFTCLECHANTPVTAAVSGTLGGVPPAFHDLRNPRFQYCVVCHVKVHGSNVSPELLQ
jgi:DmsE family decaheme c-type cytochrome